MAKVENFARILIKRTSLTGVTATMPPIISGIPSTDHTLLPQWSPSDIYVGEFFLNEQDQKLWIRTNSDPNIGIKQVLFVGDIPVISGGTGGTSGTSGSSGINGANGTNGTSGLNGSSGTLTGVTVDNKFYYLSGNTTLYVPEIVVSGATLTGVVLSGSTNFIAADSNGKLYTVVFGATENVTIGTTILHFVNGLYINQT